MSKQHGTIERLDAKFKGLRLDVDLAFQDEKTLAEVQAMLEERYQVHVPISTIGSYKERCFTPAEERIRAARERARAIRKEIEEHGLDDLAEASIAEKLEEAMQSGEPVSLSILLREQRERSRIQLERDRLNADLERIRNETKELELKIQQMQTRTKEAIEEAGNKLGKGESLTIDDINRIRERTFGLPPEAAARHPA